MADNKNSKNAGSVQRVRSWWQSDTAKAISTIIAVLLIPAAVLAWNYASSRNVDLQEGVFTEENSENSSEASTDENGGDSNGTENANQGTASPTSTPAAGATPANNQDRPIGGINDVNMLPNTSSGNYSK